jgi:hypothetical protein
MTLSCLSPVTRETSVRTRDAAFHQLKMLKKEIKNPKRLSEPLYRFIERAR